MDGAVETRADGDEEGRVVRAIRQSVDATADSFVIQSNSLARSRYSETINIHAVRLLAVAIAKVDTEMDLLHQVVVSNQELRSIFPGYAKTRALSQYVSDASDRMMGLRAEMWEGDGSWRKVNVISETRYRPRQEGLTVTFHPEMKTFLLKLTGSYTKYQLKAIAALSSTAQFHLFQFLRSHSHHGSIQVTIEDLRTLLDIPREAYTQFKDFRKRVLEPITAAINEHTDIVVSYEFKRRGRAIHAALFKVSQKPGAESIFDHAACDVLCSAGISRQAARDAVATLAPMRCIRLLALTRARTAAPGNKIKDGAAYLAKMLRIGETVDVNETDLGKHMLRTMDEFRSACFSHLTLAEQTTWLSEYRSTLAGRDLIDFDRFGRSNETPVLKQRFTEFLREHMRPDAPNLRLSS